MGDCIKTVSGASTRKSEQQSLKWRGAYISHLPSLQTSCSWHRLGEHTEPASLWFPWHFPHSCTLDITSLFSAGRGKEWDLFPLWRTQELSRNLVADFCFWITGQNHIIWAHLAAREDGKANIEGTKGSGLYRSKSKKTGNERWISQPMVSARAWWNKLWCHCIM